MALEMRYQAVPESWKWIPPPEPAKTTHTGSMFAFLASEQPPSQPAPVWPPRLETQPTATPAGADFGSELLNLIRENPDLAKRNCFVGHYWDPLSAEMNCRELNLTTQRFFSCHIVNFKPPATISTRLSRSISPNTTMYRP